MIVLSTYSISWCQNEDAWDQGDCPGYNYEDSALIYIPALKIANAKMIELKYEKLINENLKQTIKLDSAIINALENNLYSCALELEEQINNCDEEITKIKRQRNTAIGVGTGTSTLLLAILLLILL